MWALGNIAGDGPELRDQILKAKVLTPFLAILSTTATATLALRRNTTWALSNLCRGKNPAPKFEAVQDALFVLPKLIESSPASSSSSSALEFQDKEVVTDAAWALSYLTDGDNSKIETVLRTAWPRSSSSCSSTHCLPL